MNSDLKNDHKMVNMGEISAIFGTISKLDFLDTRPSNLSYITIYSHIVVIVHSALVLLENQLLFPPLILFEK